MREASEESVMTESNPNQSFTLKLQVATLGDPYEEFALNEQSITSENERARQKQQRVSFLVESSSFNGSNQNLN